MKKAIVLVSGGMDSLVTASIAKSECDEIYFLHVNYGQRTEQRELESFQKLVKHYRPTGTLIADISYLKEIGGSSLTDEKIVVKQHQHNSGVPDSYVPFRNAHLVCIAVSWAEVTGVQRIYIGAVEEDSSGYPDCREGFYKSFNKTIELGTKDETKIEIATPIIHLSKSEIIQKGKLLNAPFELSWSCYQDNKTACGVCDSCYLRIKAFKEAGMVDPIPYKKEINWFVKTE
ncbi:MAG: 7-cyano-7-deazaguanine synthase QueC [Candidatus Cloacimonetes bacterium]|nr:7-cyano-7-deazaguanine synthase QueC [Candidatus Cloacimonadota bacterium]